MDRKDGYHQVPLKEAHRNLTCMRSPRGTMRWKVLVMGLKNGNAIFQRVTEDVLRHRDFADADVDDVIVGSTGSTELERLKNHNKDLRQALYALQEAALIADPRKCELLSEKSSSVDIFSEKDKEARHRANYFPFRGGNCHPPSPS